MLPALLGPANLEAVPGDVDGSAGLDADVAPGFGVFPDQERLRQGVKRAPGAAEPPGRLQLLFNRILLDRDRAPSFLRSESANWSGRAYVTDRGDGLTAAARAAKNHTP